MRRPLARQDGADAGFTLIELLVSMTIVGIVTAAAYGVLIQVTKQSRDIAGRDETVGQARLALQQITSQIRSGNVLYDPANETTVTNGLPNSMRVFTQANGVEKCVQWQLLNSTIRSRSWSPSWQTDGIVSTWGVVARGVQNTTSPFSLANATAYGSRLLDVSIDVRDARSKGAIQTISTSVAGRNTEYGYDTGVCTPIPPA